MYELYIRAGPKREPDTVWCAGITALARCRITSTSTKTHRQALSPRFKLLLPPVKQRRTCVSIHMLKDLVLQRQLCSAKVVYTGRSTKTIENRTIVYPLGLKNYVCIQTHSSLDTPQLCPMLFLMYNVQVLIINFCSQNSRISVEENPLTKRGCCSSPGIQLCRSSKLKPKLILKSLQRWCCFCNSISGIIAGK